jgi:hypothetical protein
VSLSSAPQTAKVRLFNFSSKIWACCLAGDVFEELNEYDGNPDEDGDGGSGLMDDDSAAAAAAGEQQQDGDS